VRAPDDLRPEIVRILTEESKLDDSIDVEVRKTLGSYARPAPEGSRERLFGAVLELVAARAASSPPVLLLFDDVQWCDEASAELLHYVTRMSAQGPVLVALAARDMEIADNTA
jgi:predicted ATPase